MSSDGRRRVVFTDSPPGGSKSSSRHNSDSGVGSSDHRPPASAGATPDRGFTDRDVERQWNDLGALQDAYRTLYDSEKRMKLKLRELEEDNARLRRDAKEDAARWRDQHDEIQKLKDEKEKYDTDRKRLAEENGQLMGHNNALVAQLDEHAVRVEDLERQLRPSPVPEPVMSGALPRDAPPKMKRRESVSKSRDPKRDSKREEAKEDKKRLSKRFELGNDRQEVSKPPNASRTRRQSYIEPLGPAAPSSRSSGSIPPSPIATTTPTSRQFPAFREAPFRETSYSELPRTVHPSVHPSVTVHEPVFDEGVAWQEDGKYHPYPLPKTPKPRHHNKYPS